MYFVCLIQLLLPNQINDYDDDDGGGGGGDVIVVIYSSSRSRSIGNECIFNCTEPAQP